MRKEYVGNKTWTAPCVVCGHGLKLYAARGLCLRCLRIGLEVGVTNIISIRDRVIRDIIS